MSILDQSKEHDVYFNFINSIKSETTKRVYEYNIKLFMKFCKVTNMYDLLETIDSQNLIIKYLMSLRERRLSYNSICTNLNAIFHFYEMNDVVLNKKKINMFKGDYVKKVTDRAYTHKELKKY